MKAIRIHQFGGPEVLKPETLPDPKPLAGQVLLRTKAIGVNPVDTYIRSGMYGERLFPFTSGFDAAGVVEEVGAEVTAFKKGDRVYYSGPGAYAELIVADMAKVHPLSPKLSFEQGAAVGVPYATAYFALNIRGQARAGEWILIHGASGSVGTAAIQIARAQGLTVVGTGGTPKGRELIKAEGAHHVLDHHAPDYLDQLMQLTGGQGVGLIIEMLASVNLAKDVKVLHARGRVVVVGSRGKIEIDPRDTMTRNADIRGMSIMYATPQELADVHKALAQGFDKGTLKPVVGQTFPLAQAAEAQKKIMEPGAHGKIVLLP